jgi:hypothetical protein
LAGLDLPSSGRFHERADVEQVASVAPERIAEPPDRRRYERVAVAEVDVSDRPAHVAADLLEAYLHGLLAALRRIGRERDGLQQPDQLRLPSRGGEHHAMLQPGAPFTIWSRRRSSMWRCSALCPSSCFCFCFRFR